MAMSKTSHILESILCTGNQIEIQIQELELQLKRADKMSATELINTEYMLNYIKNVKKAIDDTPDIYINSSDAYIID